MSERSEDAPLWFDDLGTVGVRRGEIDVAVNGRRLTTLLCLLLVHANQRVSTDAVVDALWGGEAPEGAETTLVSHLYRLRKLLEPGRRSAANGSVIVTEPGGYQLTAPVDSVASSLFESLANESRSLVATDQVERGLARCDEALALWRGRPWAPHSDEPWAATPAGRLEELRAQVRERRVDCLLSLGQADRALLEAQGLAADHPLRERVWELRMLATYRLGRTDEALAVFQQARTSLAEELGVDPSAELRELHQRMLESDPALRGPTRQAPAAVAAPVDVRLPPRRGELFGRGAEIDRLRDLVVGDTLVSVVGPAGCGKTRVAVEAVRASTQAFPDGVRYVECAAGGSLDRLVADVCTVLGLESAGGDPAPALRDFLRHRRLLLLIDAAPGSVDAVAELVRVTGVGDVEAAVVVISREPLGVEGERVWPLAPLPLPIRGPADDRPDVPALTEEPTVVLFRTRATSAGAVVAESDVPVVAEICTALDGLPLAIELAAAQARSFSVTEILERVREDPSSLRGVGRSRDDVLGEVIQQSVDLLSADELRVHRAASVIPGPFTPGLLAAVVGAPTNEVRNAIAGLVHQSLLTPLGARLPGQSSRFAQLAPVRSHARASTSAEELTGFGDRRNDWAVGVVDDLPRLGSVQELAWLPALDDDLAGLRATLQDLLTERPSGTGAYVAPRLALFWFHRGMVPEWERWIRLATRLPVTDPMDRLLCRVNLASAVVWSGRSLEGLQVLPDVESLDLDGASRDSLVLLGEYLAALVGAARAAGEGALADEAQRLARRMADVTGDEHVEGLVQCVGLLGRAASSSDPATLLPEVERAHRRAVEQDSIFAAAMAAAAGAICGLRARDPDQGLPWSAVTLTHLTRFGGGGIAEQVSLRAGLLAMSGDFAQAAVLLAAAATFSRRSGHRWPHNQATRDLMLVVDQHLSQAEQEAATRAGSQLTLEALLEGIEEPAEARHDMSS